MTVYDDAAARASGAVTHVKWFGLSAAVHAADTVLHDYVVSQHHLVETRGPADGEPFATELRACADPALLRAVHAAVHAGPGLFREAFRDEWYRCRDLPGGVFAMVADRPTMKGHALLTRDFRAWAIVCRKAGDLGLTVTRTIRELVREDLLRRGALMVHAAAARTAGGRGLLLAGRAGSGKTSAAVRIARSGGVTVGTDRTALVPASGAWLAVGLPMSTRLGRGAATALGVLGALGDRAPIRARNPFGTTVTPDRATLKEPKLSLSNREAHELLGCGFASAISLDTLLVLGDGASDTVHVTELTPAETAAELAEHTLSPDPDYRSRWLSADPAPETAGDLTATLAALASCHRGLRAVWNPALHCGDDAAEVLVPPHP